MDQSKNILQELFQKEKLALPKYITRLIGGSSHEPIWMSTVILYNGNTFKGEENSSKKGAEASAATIALAQMGNFTSEGISEEWYLSAQVAERVPHLPKITPKIHPKFDLEIALLVDVENLPNFIKNFRAKHPEAFTEARIGIRIPLIYANLHIYGFVGIHHCLVDTNLGEGVTKIISPSTHSDGVDSCIQVYVGAFLLDETFDEYLIATGDKFGHSLVDHIVADDMAWKKRPGKVVSTLSHLEKALGL